MEATRRETIEAQFAVSNGCLRPVMTSLNGDNSWLLSFPRPASERATTGKAYYHIVFEPWLAGPSITLSPWIVNIALAVPPAVADVNAIEAIIEGIESVSASHASIDKSWRRTDTGGDEDTYNGGVDAILLGLHYLDHTHEPTLRLFDRRIPVVAVPAAADIIRPWKHFDTINVIHDYRDCSAPWSDAQYHPGAPFPSWITPVRLPGHFPLNFCLATIWTHTTENGEEVHETVMSSPHGTRLGEGPLQAFLDAEPKTEKLAMLHGMKEAFAAGMLNTYGAKGGLELYRKVGGFKYWIPTHNGVLEYTGIIMRLLRTTDIQRTLDWALDEEKKQNVDGNLEKPNLVQVQNGASFVVV